jgi:hypothetical protein
MNALLIALAIWLTQAPLPAATVQGIVVKPADGGPIGAARVELIRVDGTAPQSYSAISLPDGTFTILNARPGTYRLTASRTGYLRREFGQRSRTGLGMTLNLESGQQMRNLEIELRPAAVISGRVTDRQGDPAAATEVKALIPAYQDGRRILRAVQSTTTNDLGEYRLFGLAAGQYYVSATPGVSAVTSLGVNPALLAQALVSSGPLAVSASAVYYPGTTDSRTASTIDVNNGGEFGGVNITIVPVKTYHIRGNVLGGMANVTLVPDDPGLSTSFRNADASAGPFDIANVVPGDYALVARSGELLGITSVNLRDYDLDRVSIGLSPSVHVPTRVSFDDRTPGENDPDLESINMNLLADPPIPGAPPDLYGPFANGFLAFGVLMRQDFRITNLTIRNPNSPTRVRNAYIKSIRLGERDVLNEGFRIDDAEKIGSIEIVLGTHAGILSGTVVNEKQKPGANATVLLVPDAGRRRWADTYHTATTDLAGRYTIDRIAPGDYLVFSWEEVEDGAWMDPEFMKKYENRGRRVHITEGATQTANVTAIP